MEVLLPVSIYNGWTISNYYHLLPFIIDPSDNARIGIFITIYKYFRLIVINFTFTHTFLIPFHNIF